MPKDKPLELVRIPLSQIKPDPKNAKDHDVGLIIESFRRFGYVNPMVLNADDYLLAGHGRRKALLAMRGDGDPPPKNIEAKDDEWIVPVGVGPDFDQREGTAYRLVDNRSTEVGGYDEPQLLENLIALSKNGGLDATGYDTEDVDQLFRLLNPDAHEIPAQTDKAAILQETWGTESRQLWIIGKHRLLCGDSTDANDVDLLIEGNIELVVTSPPYPGADMWESKGAELVDVGNKAMEISYDILIDGGVLIWNTADIPIGNPSNICNVARDTMFALRLGFGKRGDIIWNKHQTLLNPPAFLRRPIIPHNTHESVLMFVKGDWKPRDPHGRKLLNDDEMSWNRETIWNIATEKASTSGHIAPFPVELINRCIRLWSIKGERVYDPFLGSGTTMVAAEQLNRTCYGMEIEPKYVAVTLERMSTMGLEPKLISGA